MKRYYILNTDKKFDGSVMSTVDVCENDILNKSMVRYSNMNFEQYNQEHNNKLIALEYPEFNEKYWEPYYKSLQKDFEEMTEDEYDDYLGVIPPKRWHKLSPNLEMFFVGECYTADLYRCCIKQLSTNKFFTARRPIGMPDADILNSFLPLPF